MFLAVKELKTLRQLKSFEVCWEMCGRWLCKDKDLSRLDKLVKKSGSVVSERLVVSGGEGAAEEAASDCP